jgi:hypothetical protein
MKAEKFAQEWIKSWNSHNLEDILSHYSENIEITTPMIKLAGGINNGTLKRKSAIADYWKKALIKIPDLKFELIDVMESINSIAIYYKAVMNKKAIEVMFLDNNGKVKQI